MQTAISQDKVLTEVALAVAMAFFCLMVLALVSMSSAGSKQSASKKSITINKSIQVNRNQTSPKINSSSKKTQTVKIKSESLIIYYQGQYYDVQLNRLSINSIQDKKPKILALEKELNFEQVLKMQAQLSLPDLKFTTLNNAWLNRLQGEKNND